MTPDALVAALAEIERHIGSTGWDQPARLFALVPTQELMAAEPTLAAQLHRPGGVDAATLSSIEQDDFHAGEDVMDALARIQWPAAVHGVALSLERFFLPTTAAVTLPPDPDQAAEVVANHDAREEVRVVVGALRSGETYGLARVRTHPEDLLAAEDLVPGLAAALARTLTS
ncbi:MAG: PPA1309 family protein [Propioniciclava sp.]